MSTPPVCKNTVAPGVNDPPEPIKVLSWFSVSAVVAPPTAVFNVCWPVAAVSWSASVLFVLFQLAPARMLPDSTLPAFDVVSAAVVAVVAGAATVTAAPGSFAKLSPPVGAACDQLYAFNALFCSSLNAAAASQLPVCWNNCSSLKTVGAPDPAPKDDNPPKSSPVSSKAVRYDP